MSQRCFLLALLFLVSLHAQEVCRDQNQAALVDIKSLDSTILLDLRYATTNNFTGKQIYQVARCLLVQPAAQALVRANHKFKAQGLVLKVWDAYRPHSCQKILWEIVPDDKFVANPKNGSRHNRGCAVDVTLCDRQTGAPVEMPTEFDDFSPKAHRLSTDCSPMAQKHRKLLEQILTEEGFIGLADEWWHFDYQGFRQYPLLDIPLEAFEK